MKKWIAFLPLLVLLMSSCASTPTENITSSEEFEAQEEANPIKRSKRLKNRGSSATLPPEHSGDFYQDNY